MKLKTYVCTRKVERTRTLKCADPGAIASPTHIGPMVAELIGDAPHESMWVFGLDAKSEVIHASEVGRGGIAGCAITPADALRPMLIAGARGFILVHNHPSGNAKPSHDDIETTKAMRLAGNIVGCHLVDHLVVCPREKRGYSIETESYFGIATGIAR